MLDLAGDGSHVDAGDGGSDAGGNTPPTLTLTSPQSSASIVRGQSIALAGTVADSDGVVVELAVRVRAADGAVYFFTIPPTATFAREIPTGGMPVGGVELALFAIDDDGARTNATVVVAITADGDGPTAQLSNLPPLLTNVDGLAATVGGANVATYRYQIDDGPYSGDRPVAQTLVQAELGGGVHTVRVLGKSATGAEQNSAAPTTYTWTIDLVPPVTSASNLPSPITSSTSLAANVFLDGTSLGTYSYSLVSEDLAVEIANGTNVDANTPIVTTGLMLGTYTLHITGTDLAGNVDPTPFDYTWTIAPGAFTLGGIVSGLGTGKSVQLKTGTQTTTVGMNGTFTFPLDLADGEVFAISVDVQPVRQFCTITMNQTGTIAGADQLDVKVMCENRYGIGGSVAGLLGGNILGLRNTVNNNTVNLATGGLFELSALVPNGSSYNVVVQTQPDQASPRQTCNVTNGSGIVAGADVTNIAIGCAVNPYSVGVGIAGLGATKTITLEINGSETVTAFTDGIVSFPTALPDGSSFSIAIVTPPPGQSCMFTTSSSGTVDGAANNATSIVCMDVPLSVGGVVTGLGSAALSLSSEKGLTSVNANGSFAVGTYPDGAGYNVTIATQPSDRFCQIANGSGTVAGAPVTSISITCEPNGPPQVIASTPFQGGALGLNSSIFIQFNRPVNASTVSFSGGLAASVGSAAPSTGTVSSMTISPATSWPTGPEQTLNITATAANEALTGMSSRTWNVTLPVNAARYVRAVAGDAFDGSDLANNCENPAAPCATIAAALTGAPGNTAIYVAAGVYPENNTLPTAVSLFGGFRRSTWEERDPNLYVSQITSTLTGGIAGDPNAALTCQAFQNLNFYIDGFHFVVTGNGSHTAAVELRGNCTMQFRNNVVRPTAVAGTVYGVYVDASAPRLENNQIDMLWGSSGATRIGARVGGTFGGTTVLSNSEIAIVTPSGNATAGGRGVLVETVSPVSITGMTIGASGGAQHGVLVGVDASVASAAVEVDTSVIDLGAETVVANAQPSFAVRATNVHDNILIAAPRVACGTSGCFSAAVFQTGIVQDNIAVVGAVDNGAAPASTNVVHQCSVVINNAITFAPGAPPKGIGVFVDGASPSATCPTVVGPCVEVALNTIGTTLLSSNRGVVIDTINGRSLRVFGNDVFTSQGSEFGVTVSNYTGFAGNSMTVTGNVLRGGLGGTAVRYLGTLPLDVISNGIKGYSTGIEVGPLLTSPPNLIGNTIDLAAALSRAIVVNQAASIARNRLRADECAIDAGNSAGGLSVLSNMISSRNGLKIGGVAGAMNADVSGNTIVVESGSMFGISHGVLLLGAPSGTVALRNNLIVGQSSSFTDGLRRGAASMSFSPMTNNSIAGFNHVYSSAVSECVGDGDGDSDPATCGIAELPGTTAGNIAIDPLATGAFVSANGGDGMLTTISDNDWDLKATAACDLLEGGGTTSVPSFDVLNGAHTAGTTCGPSNGGGGYSIGAFESEITDS